MKGIITYHSLDTSGSVISVHPDTFERQMESLASAGVPVLPLGRLLAPDCNRGVALTFDDGYQNMATVAWPVLCHYGFSATVFVVSDLVGRENEWDLANRRVPRGELMGWDTLAELAEQGLELGGHGRTHRALPTVESAAELESEVVGSRDRIEAETGFRPRAFAYPYGLYNHATVRAVKKAGYDSGHTSDLRFLGDTRGLRFVLPRLDAYYLSGPGSLDGWGSRRFRAHIRLRAGARRLRRSLDRAGSRA